MLGYCKNNGDKLILRNASLIAWKGGVRRVVRGAQIFKIQVDPLV